MLSACHVSGSEGRRRGDSLRNLFAPQLQSDERNSKNHWFLAAFFPPFLSLREEMGPPEAKKETDAAASVSFCYARPSGIWAIMVLYTCRKKHSVSSRDAISAMG